MRIRQYCLLLLVLCSACSNNKHQSQHDKEVLGFSLNTIKIAPQFSGVNFTKSTVSEKQFQSKVWVAYFMFTSCGGPCPILNARIKELQQKYINQNVNFIAFTVDPENDTEDVLADYATKHHAQVRQWYMVRMSLDSVKKIANEGFMLGSPDDPLLHSTRFVLIDKQSMIRGFFDGTDAQEVEKLDKSIAFLIKE
jgi:protein SCO1